MFCRSLFSSSAGILALFTAENIDVLSAKRFTVDTMLSVIEKRTTSFKSGKSIKNFIFAYFFIKNHNTKTALYERIV